MNLFRTLRATLFGKDYITLYLTSNTFIIKPVFWFDNKPSIKVEEMLTDKESFFELPSTGAFKPKQIYNDDFGQGACYHFSYVSWQPITPRIKAYYKPEPLINPVDSANNNQQ